MPFPRNWLEELVAECLSLEGYFIESGHPVQLEKKGGRQEIDIVGIKNGRDAIHVETGRGETYKALCDKIEKQLLGPRVCAEREKLSQEHKISHWQYLFVSDAYKASSPKWQELKKHFREKSVEMITFEELVKRIMDAKREWQSKNSSLKGTKTPMLPENLWLVKLLEKIEERSIKI